MFKQPLTKGVHQGSILKNSSCLFLFAGDTTISCSHSNMNLLLDTLSQDLEFICAWFKHNRLAVNWSKTNAILFNFKSQFSLNQSNIDISFDSNPILLLNRLSS